MSTGRDFFVRWRRIIKTFVFVDSLLPRFINHFIFNLINSFGGRAFIFLRYILVCNLAESCGENVAIFRNVTIESIERIRLGKNVSIHTGCYLDGAGGISIGDDVSIAHCSSVLSANHTWGNPDIPIKYNPIKTSLVFIENDVWIGCGCRVLCGTRIGTRSVVAAGAVVCKDVDSHTVVGGVPARLIKQI